MAREFMDDIRRSALPEARKLLRSELQGKDVSHGLGELVNLFQAGEVKSIEIVGVNTSTFYTAGNTRHTTNLTYEVELTSGWLAGTVVIVDEGNTRGITTARFHRNPAALEYLTRFTFQGKQPIHFAFFFFSIIIPIFCIVALTSCVRTKMKHKWIWVIFILLGFVTFRLDWTTGQLDWQLLSFQLLGASAFKMGIAAPWIINVALPIGAIVFLLKRKQLALNTVNTSSTSQAS